MEFAISVSEITSHIKRSLEEDFSQVKIIGEISNFKSHVSGHWYFTLKDSNASINCTMWKGVNNYVFFTPKDGMKIIITGRITVYPPRGTYQLDAKSMKPAGEGELQKAFEELKQKLKDEGLFEVEAKKSIPNFPKQIGIVTGSSTAALKDMLSVAERRYPLVKIIIAPARVQGEGSAKEISDQINVLNKKSNVDLIIIARGGGSLEDLWPFNEEIVARSIFASKIPIISGVGHEVDFTIADFVADLRAPTPSAAMELATPNKDELFAFITEFNYNSTNNITEKLDNLKDQVDQFIHSFGFRNLSNIINNKKQTVDNYLFRIQSQIGNFLYKKKNNLAILQTILESNNIEHILNKGFVLVEQNDKIIKRKSKFNLDTVFNIRFADGKVKIGNE
ncbi:MAG: exodeoxyribonuclease VII large subunit [Melioribacteraceae bacterium]|nr:exodeoxyribonuclease VII large subunit [Melioribacteraceae bacterium]